MSDTTDGDKAPHTIPMTPEDAREVLTDVRMTLDTTAATDRLVKALEAIAQR